MVHILSHLVIRINLVPFFSGGSGTDLLWFFWFQKYKAIQKNNTKNYSDSDLNELSLRSNLHLWVCYLETSAVVLRSHQEEARLRQLRGRRDPLLVVVGPAVLVALWINVHLQIEFYSFYVHCTYLAKKSQEIKHDVNCPPTPNYYKGFFK